MEGSHVEVDDRGGGHQRDNGAGKADSAVLEQPQHLLYKPMRNTPEPPTAYCSCLVPTSCLAD